MPHHYAAAPAGKIHHKNGRPPNQWNGIRLAGGILVEGFVLQHLTHPGGASGSGHDTRVADLEPLV